MVRVHVTNQIAWSTTLGTLHALNLVHMLDIAKPTSLYGHTTSRTAQ